MISFELFGDVKAMPSKCQRASVIKARHWRERRVGGRRCNVNLHNFTLVQPTPEHLRIFVTFPPLLIALLLVFIADNKF